MENLKSALEDALYSRFEHMEFEVLDDHVRVAKGDNTVILPIDDKLIESIIVLEACWKEENSGS